MKSLLAAVLLAGLAACSSASTDPGTGSAGGDTPPSLTIDTPTRGTTVDGSSIKVTGHATDAEGPVTVTVNGTAAQVGADGSFTATVTLADGIDVIETHALDSTLNDVRDVRAVLAGALAPTDGTSAAPIGTHASTEVLKTIGNTMADDAAKIDYTSMAKALNPIYDNGGCLGANVNVTSVTIGDVGVALVPATDKLNATVTVQNVTVKLSASYKVACIGGSGTITVTSTAAHISGALGVDVANGKLTTSLPSSTVTLDGFNVSVSGVPSEVTDLFNSTIKGKVQTALSNAIEAKVPGIANDKLSGLLAKPFDVSILGHDTQLTVTPTAATISSTGLFVGVDTNLVVADGTGGMFLTEATEDPSALMDQTQNLGFAVANDFVNQLLAGLWAAGAFDQTIDVSTVSVLSAVLDNNASKLVLTLSLPPTAATDPSGNLKLSIGDAIISVQDASGTELQQLSLSVQTSVAVAATPAGTITMALDTPTVYGQVLKQTDDGSLTLTDAQVEGIVSGAWGIIGGQASQALSKLPLPTIAGVKLGNPTVNSVSNYVLADIPLQ